MISGKKVSAYRGPYALVPVKPPPPGNDLGNGGVTTNLWEQVKREEHRNVIGLPKKWQIVDFMGMAYGTYFILEGWNRPKPNLLNVMIGSTMVYIHAMRFWYAPQTPRELE